MPCRKTTRGSAKVAGERRVLIPGGTGYVGGRVAEALHESGWQVRVASRRADTWLGPAGESIEVVPCDWRDASDRNRALTGCDALIMLAAANEIEAARDPVAAETATATQCLAWLQGARLAGVSRFLYLSTIHVYGPDGDMPISEAMPPRPVHPYAETHLAAEVFVDAAGRRGDFHTTIFRLSNAFGAPVDAAVNRWTLLVNDLARQAAETGHLVLRSDGLQARDFIPLHAVCGALRWALESPSPRPLYNLGSGQSLTVFEMASRVAERCAGIFGRTPPISRPEPADGAVAGRYLLDVGAIKRDGGLGSLAWEPEVDAVLRFCRSHFGAR
jgi:UDP-glucose 4-epimerase